ncbi:MAG TPA: SDR family oxidoreductase [Gaiellales bacterium]|nr:SDR family oxidoreductase [Gaiellales bacterium]
MERAAIVTGGGTGIGRAAALALHRDGFGVLIAGRRAEPLEETRALIGEACAVHPGDIREPEVQAGLVDECLERFGRIDCLVNNAGGQFTAAAEDITPGGWRAVRRLNLDAPWFLTQAVAKRWMIPNGGGRVISVVLCPERGIAGMAHSSAARAGMGALTRTLAMEWGRHGIALNCVAPGWIDTEGVRGYGLDLDEVAAQVPMKRLGSAAEVGDLIAFLASPTAGYVTGQTIAIDGGVDLTSSGWEPPQPRG